MVVHVPRQSPTKRPIAISNARTEQAIPCTISFNEDIAVKQKPTIFPPRRFGEEVFGVQAAKDKNKSSNDGDEIRGHEFPGIALIVVSRGTDGGTCHVVSLARSVRSPVSKSRRRKLRQTE